MLTIDKETFSYWVTHPDDLTPTDFNQLQESLSEYPYCQTLYTLTAKAASLHQKAQTLPAVRQAATHALSRNALRKLIDNEFQWSPNLLSRLNELSAKHVPIPDDYQQESYALFKEKAGLSGHLPKFPIPVLRLPEQAPAEPLPTTPTPEDPTLAESTLQQELTQIAEVTPEPPAAPELSAAEQERQRQLELIENFIRAEPRIPPVRTKPGEMPEQEDLTKRVRPAQGLLVTESFARILLKQGKTDKAREIYEQLMEKNPEKKAYFAAKIAELQSGQSDTQAS